MARMNTRTIVDVFSDPGLPSRLVEDLVSGDHERTQRYDFSRKHRQIPLRDDGTLDLETVLGWAREDSHVAVVVTEIPRRAGHRPKLAALHPVDGLVVISLPALGWIGLRARLEEAVLGSLDVLTDPDRGDGPPEVGFGVVHEQDPGTGASYYVASPWWHPGRLRLVLGMVRTNEPLSTAPRLSGVLAAASATGAFGIFYSSIWSMADALPEWRLALITIMVVLAMTGWLIASNGLWERRRRMGSLEEAVMYNASTIVSLIASVTMLYIALFVGILVGALVVIDAHFMSTTIGMQTSVWNYVDIAWLSASMGTVAGALGSNFDSQVDVRNLTQGRRQEMRYRIAAEE